MSTPLFSHKVAEIFVKVDYFSPLLVFVPMAFAAKQSPTTSFTNFYLTISSFAPNKNFHSVLFNSS
jgi:hypothetical protein